MRTGRGSKHRQPYQPQDLLLFTPISAPIDAHVKTDSAILLLSIFFVILFYILFALFVHNGAGRLCNLT